MATVTAYTAARMKLIEDASIVDGLVVGDNLWLTRYDGVQIDAGNVRGVQGPVGTTGDTAILMVTSTTRPINPYDGSFIYETDTKFVYSWNGSVWVYRGGTILCTSITRPAVPFAGLTIWETDTLRSYVWNGTAWSYTGGIVICTSATRPASPFAGLTIFETNTLKTYTWSGSAWVDNNPKAMQVKVNRTTPQGVANGVISNIVWTNEEYDSDGLWTPGASADRFIIPANATPGTLWRATFNGTFSSNPTGIRIFGLLHYPAAGGGYTLGTYNTYATANWYVSATVSGEARMSPGDVIYVYGYQTSGVVINMDPTLYGLNFTLSQVI